ncbi:hypothetical protein scyTo_0014807 [Scyliorhinus torazame]|uniref:EGF-like domain-containing protein n=1 Tax=Scyliorhinus torazame TaxID=75743 RepID=A0A401NV56_SCYTO|nr:hypothetical protein [Scyliorhinus torazame]
MECDVCHENCIDCDEEQCYWCETGFFLSEIECVYTCQGGYYGNEDSAVCDVCHPTCDTCHGPSFEDCDSCKNDQIFQDGMCILNSSVPCKEGNYWNVEEKSCFPCSDLCKTCTGEGWNECTSCHSGFYLYREICVSDCPKHTFADSISEMCEQCEEGCETCSGNKNDCQQCITVQHRPLYLHLGKCLSECPLGYFISTRNTCAKCDDTCESCEATPENCQSCVKPYLLDNNSCQKQCSRKQYASAQGFCKRCPANCEACNEHNCTECSRHFFFHKGACLQDCPPGFFQSTQTFTCTSCHPECSVCDGPDSDDCEGCANPSLLMHDGQCLKSCPEGTYVDKGTQDCQECHQTCRTCEGPYSTDCIHCREGMMQNSQGHCVMHKDCALNMYMDQICRPCHKKCHRCYGPSEQDCLSCTHNYFLLNRTCVDACPGGYYTEESRRHCFACHKSCETCSGRSNTQCLTCKADWYRLKLTCVKTCGSGHFANGSTGVCEKCHTSCKECRGPGDAECLSCQDDNFLMKSHNRCYSSCPERYYEDEWEQTCARCHPSCKICDGKGPIRCTSCFWGFRMVGSICSSQCFAGEYLLSEDPEIMCGKCHDTCLECKGPGLYNCTNCHPGLLLNVEDGNCLNCCRSALSDFEDCCDCDMRFDECVLRKAVVVPDVEGSGKPALFAIASVLLIMGIGIGVFLLLKSRSKAKPTNRAGYEKLPNQAKSIPVYNASRDSVSFQEHQATDYKDRQEKIYDEEDDDDDIVYMGQDGTVYRKFKYGLLDDDEDDELEYDDESYSFR